MFLSSNIVLKSALRFMSSLHIIKVLYLAGCSHVLIRKKWQEPENSDAASIASCRVTSTRLFCATLLIGLSCLSIVNY